MTISTQFSLDTGLHHLMVSGLGGLAVAGPRIFRAPPHPDILFAYAEESDAEEAAKKLQAYLDALPVQKKKAKTRAMGAFSE